MGGAFEPVIPGKQVVLAEAEPGKRQVQQHLDNKNKDLVPEFFSVISGLIDKHMGKVTKKEAGAPAAAVFCINF
jgi:hypothetical protein